MKKTRNKLLIITSIVFLIVAAICIIVGLSLSGFDWIKWFGSKWAMWFYVVGGLYIVSILVVIFGDLIKKI